jgi:hypothetical protein
VFAPAAARLHEAVADRARSGRWSYPTTVRDGVQACRDAVPTDEYEGPSFPEASVRADGADGEVLVVDGFGNAVTNVPGRVLDGRWGEYVEVDGRRVAVERSYAHRAPGEALVTVGSHGNVELAVNRGRGDEAFGVGVGDSIELRW